MKILSWNVNGLRAVFKKNFFDVIAAEKPDILCLQETKLQVEQVPKAFYEHSTMTPFRPYWASAQKKGYAGVATFCLNNPLDVRSGMGIDRFDREGRTLTADMGDFYLVNAYFPNAQPGLVRLEFKLDFDRAVSTYVAELGKEKPVIICGDFNVAHEEIDLTHPKANEKNPGFYIEERKWFSNLMSRREGFVDVFRERHPGEKGHYTWWSYRQEARAKNVGWRIDYFVVHHSFTHRVRQCRILPHILGSDHCPIEIELF